MPIQEKISINNGNFYEFYSSDNALIQKAGIEILQRCQKIKTAQDGMLLDNKVHSEINQSTGDYSGDGLSRKIREDLERDYQSLKNFYRELGKTNPGTTEQKYQPTDDFDIENPYKLLYSVTTYKMENVLLKVRELCRSDSIVASIATGSLPSESDGILGYSDNSIQPNLIPILDVAASSSNEGNNRLFWGTSKVTYLSAAILSINFSLVGSSNGLSLEEPYSPIYHAAPLPLNDELSGGLAGYRFFKKGDYTVKRPSALFFVHGGFAFGGSRGTDILYPGMNNSGYLTYRPDDCSSAVARWTNLKVAYNTDEFYRLCCNTGSVTIKQEIMDKFTVVTDKTNTQPGDIYLHRGFKGSEDPNTSVGTGGGHITLIWNFDRQKNTVITLGTGRDMPHNREGFGAEEFPLEHKKPNNPQQLTLKDDYLSSFKKAIVLRPKI